MLVIVKQVWETPPGGGHYIGILIQGLLGFTYGRSQKVGI